MVHRLSLQFYFLVKFLVGLVKFIPQFLVFGSKIGLLARVLAQVVQLHILQVLFFQKEFFCRDESTSSHPPARHLTGAPSVGVEIFFPVYSRAVKKLWLSTAVGNSFFKLTFNKSAKVAKKSVKLMVDSEVVPAASLPGHFAIKGTRCPPS